MALPVENIVQDLFQTNSLENVSVQQIQQVINDHPYYDAAYFLLAKKLQSSNESGYNTAIQQAALHFSNSSWLNFNLQENGEDDVATIADFNTTEIIKEENISANIIDLIPAEDEAIRFVEMPVMKDTAIQETAPGNITNDIANDENEEITSREDDTIEEAITESYNEEPVDDAVSKKLSSMLQEQASAFEKPVEATAEISIENTPYHRVDYFDSQGIKLEESAANDKLGTQLKRFTDWLKQMKKANPNQVDLGNDVTGETQVQNIAQHSNEQEEVVTETMAEVLIKQGKPEQAIQIYEKLSFNNPSKTAYFAAKIQELKG